VCPRLHVSLFLIKYWIGWTTTVASGVILKTHYILRSTTWLGVSVFRYISATNELVFILLKVPFKYSKILQIMYVVYIIS
jgi:hypothetical protein